MRTGRSAPWAALLALALVLAFRGAAAGAAAPAPCRPAPLSARYAARVERALEARRDVWGDRLLRAPGGPTYRAASRFLQPLLLARGPHGTPLTQSGVYYLPFGQPAGAGGGGAVALHVADGSQILARRRGGPSLTVWVGATGRERFGACRSRLAQPRLRGGFLPVLETTYVDGTGTRYRQESFAARLGGTGRLVSFVAIAADARHARADGRVRLAPSVGRLRDSVTLVVPRGTVRTIYAEWPSARTGAATIDEATYREARAAVGDYWRRRLAEGMTIEVPERRVADALRALLIQDLVLTWRYSIGNPYEEFSFPESVDVAQVLAEYGFGDVARAMLRTSLTRKPTPYPNWKRGERLAASAEYFRLFRDRAYVEQATPTLAGYVRALGRQLAKGGRGLLGRERYSSDIPDSVYGLHSQTVVWAGLEAMSSVWSRTGHGDLAATSRRLAARLEAGLRRAVRASQRRLPDGSLFVPVRLLDDERPYGSLTESRAGSYWNLVVPYALASGFFAPGSAQARGLLRYLLRHGSRLLGLVRAGGYALYGPSPPAPVSGTDEVYGINVARFLADEAEADQLVLSLYGQLAAAMTPGTFVSGEAATVAPLPGEASRAMYLPPNSASNAAFLETLRLELLHETRDGNGNPRGLELAYATPRAWLAPGRRIAVRRAPTSFGPVSYEIDSHDHRARATVDAPTGRQPATLRLRLRLPRRLGIGRVLLAGRPYARVERATGTIDLSGRRGRLELEIRYVSRRP